MYTLNDLLNVLFNTRWLSVLIENVQLRNTILSTLNELNLFALTSALVKIDNINRLKQ